MERKGEIMKKAIGIDYQKFEKTPIEFDYEAMMEEVGYSLEEVQDIQKETGIGNTPLIELKNITNLARQLAPAGKGARIFIKDEACNPSGSFKARRGSVSAYHAKMNGYKGLISATSGNYGAAVASQAAMRGLDCIVVQEVFDSRYRGQPEILEKGRKCESYGAEVVQLTVGPELFYEFLNLLEETGYFNASLYTPFGIAGVETLGYELAEQTERQTGREPDAVIVTNAGGGNLTGTARGLLKAGCDETQIIGASVDLTGLHMASDKDFNKKSFTTGHTGFGMPFSTWPDRSDVPRSAARPLRYIDRYVTVTQGEVFYITEALAQLDGLERGPAGNTSLAAAFEIAQTMDENEVLVVQETEYTSAGKHPYAQLTFAEENGVEITRGNPETDRPGERIVIPEKPEQIQAREVDVDKLRASYLKNVKKKTGVENLKDSELKFLAEELNISTEKVSKLFDQIS
ncbi:2-amino-4-oxopentanoate thiolase subunit OrtB [Natranaerobius trueperi]|uniref:PLP-dependent lyase/thiolase n=1 Tax=Natranaerobius trueperi TaxID=759412 RepID=A0A226BW69_9FIRM|nr:PLP-dependent lyase/thiolase [Natranaerobius trueperi]